VTLDRKGICFDASHRKDSIKGAPIGCIAITKILTQMYRRRGMADAFRDRYFAGDESSSKKPSCRAGTEPKVWFLLLAFEIGRGRGMQFSARANENL
jgi:hypothetical protein